MWRSLCVAVCLLWLGSAEAATLNVGPAGSGAAYTTIQSAINAANNGDTVLVAPGTYYENIDFMGKAITVEGTGSASTASTIIHGVGSGSTVTFSSGELRTSVLSFLTITGGAAVGGVYVNISAPTISNNVITGNACYGVYVTNGAALIQANEISDTSNPFVTCTYPLGAVDPGVGIMLYGSGAVGTLTFNSIIDNVIENNPSGTLNGTTQAGGIETYETIGTLIEDNTIRNNKGFIAGGFVSENTYRLSFLQNLVYGNAGEFLATGGQSALAGGISILASPSTSTFSGSVGPYVGIIAGNTFADNSYTEVTHNQLPNEEASDVAIEGNVGQMVFTNNIVSGDTTLPAVLCGAFFNSLAVVPLMIDHNDVYNSNPQGTAYGGVCANNTAFYGNISEDPEFVSPSSSNYQLQAGSPAIDAGNDSAFLLPTDIAGNPRLQDATGKSYLVVDMGAYEASGSTAGISSILTAVPSVYFDPSKIYASAEEGVSFAEMLSGITTNGEIADFFQDGKSIYVPFVPQTGSIGFNFTPSPGLHEYVAVTSAQNGLPPTPSVPFYLLVPSVSGVSATATALMSSLNPAAVGASVTFTATVAATQSGDGTPTGSVLFADGTTTVATVPLSNGVATWTTNMLAPGTHPISATFVPATGFAASAASLTQVVGYATVTTTTDSPEPSNYGQPVVFSIHVAAANGSAGTPSGKVNLVFCHGAEITATLDGSGNGSVVTPAAGGISDPAGSCSYTAEYLGDGTFLPSSSASTTYVVNPATSTTTVSAGPNPGFVGQSLTITAQVAGFPSTTLGPGGIVLQPGSQVATGTVVFSDGGVPIGTATLNAAGQASMTFTAQALGVNRIVAVYSGDANLQGSTSAEFDETVAQVPTTTALIAAPNPGVQNETVTISATVAASAGTAAPFGAVTFYDGPTALATVNVVPGSGPTASASYATSTLAVGTHSLTALFQPLCAAVVCQLAGFTGSQSGAVSLVIQPQDFSVSADPPSITIETEHHRSMQLTLDAIGQFDGPITLSCAGVAPMWASCSFAPATVTLQMPTGAQPVVSGPTASATTTLTIETDAIKDFQSDARGAATVERAVFAGLLPVVLLGFARKRRRLRGLAVVALASVMAMTLTACSGQYPGHVAPGTYTITVQAQGTAIGAATPTTHTLDITLTVTP